MADMCGANPTMLLSKGQNRQCRMLKKFAAQGLKHLKAIVKT